MKFSLACLSVLVASVYGADDCTPCDDNPSSWMQESYVECPNSWQVKQKNQCTSEGWKKNFICQYSCYVEQGVKYERDGKYEECCVDDKDEKKDYGVRFSKIAQHSQSKIGNFQLRDHDFPLNDDLAYILRSSENECISVVRFEDCFECNIPTKELIDAVGGPPKHPSKDPEFWAEFEEVLDAQDHRKKNKNPVYMMPMPSAWAGDDIHDCAENVHDEFPGLYHGPMMAKILGKGVKVDEKCLPSKTHREFLKREVAMSDLITWAIGMIAPNNFGVKWYVGMMRPEETAWAIAKGEFTEHDGVPKEIVDRVMDMGMDSQFDFGAYAEGSPTHPSWPAMHSAGSCMSYWADVMLELDDDQRCELQRLDWAVSYARTIAGVHYPMDNMAGLNIGQEILHRNMKDYLVDKYGVEDEKYVQKRLDEKRHDWRNFKDTQCYQKWFDCVHEKDSARKLMDDYSYDPTEDPYLDCYALK